MEGLPSGLGTYESVEMCRGGLSIDRDLLVARTSRWDSQPVQGRAEGFFMSSERLEKWYLRLATPIIGDDPTAVAMD